MGVKVNMFVLRMTVCQAWASTNRTQRLGKLAPGPAGGFRLTREAVN